MLMLDKYNVHCLINKLMDFFFFRRFGYDWDCDPVIPSSLWAILLITLFLAILFGWAVSYIADAKGPDRFDTQKTIPMLSKAE